MGNKPLVFALTANTDLAEEVVGHLGLDLGKVMVKHFKDDEILVEMGQSVRSQDVFIIQSTCNPVSENLMELLIAIDACKRASAKSINAVIPYFGYARQDRKAKGRQPITAKLVANLIETAGADRVITFDLHAPQIQGFFDIPVDDLTAVNMLGAYLRDKYNSDEVVVVSPDHGGATRARSLANIIKCPIAIVDKRRPEANQVEALYVIGKVKGKMAIIIDDICDTAGSLIASTNILLEQGAIGVRAVVTHGVLSDPAFERIADSKLEKLLVTNTIPLRKTSDKITQISVGYMLAKTIEAIYEGHSVSSIYTMYAKEN
ncbi:MAG: ribose-phosphate diphosphokinase [Erysipelotrichaceae bacterium]